MPTSKINFCGDSYCSGMSEFSWVTLLLKYYNAKVMNLGFEGACHEIAIETFDPAADITIFVWTDSNRLMNRRRYPLNYSSARRGTFKKEGRIYQAALAYYEWLHDPVYANKRQARDLYWFDNEILSKYDKPLIHLWSFDKTYTFRHGVEFTLPLKNMYKYIDIAENTGKMHTNHMSVADNNSLFHLIKDAIDSHLTIA